MSYKGTVTFLNSNALFSFFFFLLTLLSGGIKFGTIVVLIQNISATKLLHRQQFQYKALKNWFGIKNKSKTGFSTRQMGRKHGVEERKLEWPLFHFKMLDNVLTKLWNECAYKIMECLEPNNYPSTQRSYTFCVWIISSRPNLKNKK